MNERRVQSGGMAQNGIAKALYRPDPSSEAKAQFSRERFAMAEHRPKSIGIVKQR